MNRIEKYYDLFPEKEKVRLSRSAYDNIESEITKKFLQKYLKPKSKTIDIGCGPGHYSTWLLKNEHQVHLVDLSEGLLRLARETIEHEKLESNVLNISKADARDLSNIPTESFDVTLFMGPLYHLLSKQDREKALEEALRVTKPGGIIFSAIINRICPFMAMMHQSPETLAHELEHDPEEMSRILETGNYENFDESPNEFTDAHFATLDEVPEMYKRMNVDTVEAFACEGIASYLYDKTEVIKKSPKAWNQFLEIIYKNANRPELLGASEHVVFVGRKK
jgi:ubiquinone/menaquinone biosynthesis C-methylase UbiE